MKPHVVIRLGTRSSPLALAQAAAVAEGLRRLSAEVEIVPMKTEGDRLFGARLAEVGGKGLFVRELEEALAEGAIDAAVHSLKDPPAGPRHAARPRPLPSRRGPGDPRHRGAPRRRVHDAAGPRARPHRDADLRARRARLSEAARRLLHHAHGRARRGLALRGGGAIDPDGRRGGRGWGAHPVGRGPGGAGRGRGPGGGMGREAPRKGPPPGGGAQSRAGAVVKAAGPLEGRTIVGTRAAEQAPRFVEQLEAAGARVLQVPMIAIEPPPSWTPVDEALDSLETFTWVIFTSVNGVTMVDRRLRQLC